MKDDLGFFLDLYVFTSGRMIFTLGKVADAIERRADAGLAPTLDHVRATIEHARAVLALEHEFAWGLGRPRNDRRIGQIHRKLGRAMVAFRDAIQSYIDCGGEDGDPVPARALVLRDKLFPRGVQAITHVSFVEELAAVDNMLASIEAHHADLVDTLGLDRHLDRIRTLNAAYREAQEEEREVKVGFEDVRAGRKLAQEMFAEVVARIIGSFPTRSAADRTARTTLLAEVIVQSAAIAELLRQRRGAVADVDPDTGEPLSTAPVANAPSPTPGPATAA